MRRWHWVLVIFVALCNVLGGIYCHAQDARSLPDGWNILKEKMENQDIPTVDFSKFTFAFPDTIPDEVHTIKGYLWSGQHAHSVRRGGHGGAVSYLFIISYDKETGKMRFYRCSEIAASLSS